MPDRESPASAVLEALGFALFVRAESGVLRLSGEPPDWLRRLWPALAASGAELRVAEASPFLENFLVDAAECWSEGTGRRVKSGPWIEQDTDSQEVPLEATALHADGHAVLLVERLGEAFDAKSAILQKARETVITYQRLNAEMQKKDILLHCVAEDMNAALGNIITALRLLEMEQNPFKKTQLLNLAMLATQEQQSLIEKVLGMFQEELDWLYARTGDTRVEADLQEVARRAVETAARQFAEKGVRLRLPEIHAHKLRIPVNAGHLERVFLSLLENALQYTPAGREVVLRLDVESDAVLLRVEDEGPDLPPSVRESLFAKFESASNRSLATALGLHFCRITVENCSGEIGHDPRETGGNCFWIRLPICTPA